MEIWKDIIWYEWLYQVSNIWNIKSLWNSFNRKEKILKHQQTKKWYIRILLSNKLNIKQYLIHRLVAQAFIPNLENKSEINHINWIKSDNRIENLEWCNRNENILHSYRVLWHKITKNHNFIKNHPNKWKFGKNNPKSKKVNQYDLDWNFIKTWDSIMDIKRQLWFNTWAICSNCKWLQKTTGWFIWKYFNL